MVPSASPSTFSPTLDDAALCQNTGLASRLLVGSMLSFSALGTTVDDSPVISGSHSGNPKQAIMLGSILGRFSTC